MAKKVQIILDILSIQQQDSKNYQANLTIKDIMTNLSKKYIDTNDIAIMTPEALRNPLTHKMLTTSMIEGIN